MFIVMAGLVPAIHVSKCAQESKTWMPGTRPGMTERMLEDLRRHGLQDRLLRL
jgi:hypothetical protein